MAKAIFTRTPVVLIVEDEPLVRMCATLIAEDAGFEVLEAGNADEALRMLERREDIGVIFTDVDMPGSMNGLELACTVRQRWPEIKVIVTSGRATVANDDLPAGGRFFSKPYQPSQIEAALRQCA